MATPRALPATMAVLAFTLLLLGACTVQSEPPALVLATWNLEHLAAHGGDGCKARSAADYRRLRRHAERLEADLIALQEVENRAAVARVFDPQTYAIEISRQPDQDLGTCRRLPERRRTMQRTGFAINKERLAELGLRYERLPDFAAIGLKSRRWGTRIRIEALDGAAEPVELLSVHLKSGCSYARLDLRDIRRQCRVLVQQRGILEEWIDTRAKADRRFILLGDFNRQLDQRNDHFWIDIADGEICDWAEHPRLGRQCRPATRRTDADAELVLANAGKPFPYPFNPRFPYAIDHLVFDPVTARRIRRGSYRVLDYDGEGPAPSDHHPIAISLGLGLPQRP